MVMVEQGNQHDIVTEGEQLSQIGNFDEDNDLPLKTSMTNKEAYHCVMSKLRCCIF
jgi:hypothetical protein